MMLKIEGVLSAQDLTRCREIIDAAEWVDGNETSGHQSRLAKRNQQLAHGGTAERQAGDLIAQALAHTPQFVAAALPLKVFPPLFNRYSGGQEFGAHVDNAIRGVQGTQQRVRSDLSCTVFLAEPDTYEGGELVVEDLFGEHRVKLAAGDLVLYPASSVHRVTPVTRGERVACFFWLQSMVRDHGEREKLYRLDCTIQTLSAERGGDDPVVIDLTSLYHNLLRDWADT